MRTQIILRLSMFVAALTLYGCSTTPQYDKNFSNSVKSSVERQRINSGPSANSSSQVDAIEVKGAYNTFVNSRQAPAPLTPPMNVGGQ